MKLPPLYLLHPAAVHFPIALLTLGLAAELWFQRRRTPSWLAEAAPWLLWLGTASAWAAMGLGLLAEDTARHVSAAWEALADHKELGFWTVGLFTVLSLWRCRMVFASKISPEGRLSRWVRYIPAGGRKWELVFNLFWLVAAAVLMATAYHGGEVVYTFGMGVQQ